MVRTLFYGALGAGLVAASIMGHSLYGQFFACRVAVQAAQAAFAHQQAAADAFFQDGDKAEMKAHADMAFKHEMRFIYYFPRCMGR